MNLGTDYYRILGIAPAADFAALKSAYYRRAKQCHPDRFAGSREKEEEFKTVVEAFDVLSDPLRRRCYDEAYGSATVTGAGAGHGQNDQPLFFDADAEAILDSFADDTLEELIVGNTLPQDATLRTLLLDLERTAKFCLFREAKTFFCTGHVAAAHTLFRRAVEDSPMNILYRWHLAQTSRRLGHWKQAQEQLVAGIQLGLARRPPLRLERFRQQLAELRRTHGGVLGRWQAFLNAPPPDPGLPPDENLRREVSRAIDRLSRRQPGPRRLNG